MTPGIHLSPAGIEIPEVVLGTIMSFAVHGSDVSALSKMRKVSPEVARGIDQNLPLFNQGCILEIRGHPDPSYEGVWILKSDPERKYNRRYHVFPQPSRHWGPTDHDGELDPTSFCQKYHFESLQPDTNQPDLVLECSQRNRDFVMPNMAVSHNQGITKVYSMQLQDATKFPVKHSRGLANEVGREIHSPLRNIFAPHNIYESDDFQRDPYRVGKLYDLKTPKEEILYTKEDQLLLDEAQLSLGGTTQSIPPSIIAQFQLLLPRAGCGGGKNPVSVMTEIQNRARKRAEDKRSIFQARVLWRANFDAEL